MLFCFKKEIKQVETVEHLFCLFQTLIMLFRYTGNHAEACSQLVCNLSVRLAIGLFQFTELFVIGKRSYCLYRCGVSNLYENSPQPESCRESVVILCLDWLRQTIMEGRGKDGRGIRWI